ncbi:hypothetical protein AsAng_0025600 [Aureispira anguillae]|uniref:Uncharacterized protein n=1 Tax=Aureispira anguillae TaxID=2864201 RepID=A0A916DTZ0_9BACT|nr:hypothetical protein AsAng_0025600 [Aureispira anguillae]
MYLTYLTQIYPTFKTNPKQEKSKFQMRIRSKKLKWLFF